MIIGIGGAARSGKGAIASVFIKQCGFKEINFADALKECCSKAFNLPLETFYKDELKDMSFSVELTTEAFNAFIEQLQAYASPIKEIGVSSGTILTSPRHMLQYMGTEIARDLFGNDIWIRIFRSRVLESNCHVVCSDVRFMNELELIKELEGTTILVKRPSIETVKSHVSETLAKHDNLFDVIVNNNGHLTTVQSDVRMWITLRFPGVFK